MAEVSRLQTPSNIIIVTGITHEHNEDLDSDVVANEVLKIVFQKNLNFMGDLRIQDFLCSCD